MEGDGFHSSSLKSPTTEAWGAGSGTFVHLVHRRFLRPVSDTREDGSRSPSVPSSLGKGADSTTSQDSNDKAIQSVPRAIRSAPKRSVFGLSLKVEWKQA